MIEIIQTIKFIVALFCVFDLPYSLASKYAHYLDYEFGEGSKMLHRYFSVILIIPTVFILFLVMATNIGQWVLSITFLLFVVPSGFSILCKPIYRLINQTS
ncbi:hypothetical protein G7059_00155 [Erysipelothrix sp. HDW6A]|uniref:hypothetical protein n=1 Tax=Erysipelothrix sp. HDW6A TaxID=2714928 RepID=UPI00140AD021|nr:hypothetical protein [Erysipelothrix sp. HDW6A]QIK56367.1 hypothetical protein G7059_00155 [Erysipelothrix sp. HDW6A]